MCPCRQCPQLSEPACFLWGCAQWPFLSPIDTESAWLIVWISSTACTDGGMVLGLLSHAAPGFQLWFYFHLYMWVDHWGLLRLPWRAWVYPCKGYGSDAAAWVPGVLAAPGPQGRWWLGQQELYCSRRGWQPVLANTLQYSCPENPPDREAWQATVYRVAKSWTRPK